MAKIQLNGKKVSLKNRTSIKQLLLNYKLLNKRVAIELNGKIIPSTKYNIYLNIRIILICIPTKKILYKYRQQIIQG